MKMINFDHLIIKKINLLHQHHVIFGLWVENIIKKMEKKKKKEKEKIKWKYWII